MIKAFTWMMVRWTQGSWRGVTIITHLLEWSTAGQCLHGQLDSLPSPSSPPLQRSSQRHSSMCSLRWRQPCCLGFCRAKTGRTTWRPWSPGTLTGDRRTGQHLPHSTASNPALSTPDFISQLSGFSQKLWDKIQSRRPRFEAMNSQALLSSSYYSMQTELKMGRRRSYGEPWSTGTPEKWLSKTLQTLGPECFCMYLCIIEPPEMQKPLYFIKRTGFSVPLVSGLYKICWIMRTFACLTHKILHHCWTIQKLVIIIALVHTVLTSLWSAFLAMYSIQQGRAWERACIVLNNTSTRCHRLLEIYQKPLKHGRLYILDLQWRSLQCSH